MVLCFCVAFMRMPESRPPLVIEMGECYEPLVVVSSGLYIW
jgi:hypothetical protein